MSDRGPWGFATRAIHAGQEPDPATGAVVVPIHQTTTFAQEDVGVHKGYEYSRSGNPTRQALEECLASLEGGAWGASFGSGLAATSVVALTVLKAGDHVVAMDDQYGGTYRLFTRVFERFGITFEFVDATNLDLVRRALQRPTRLIWLESPTNPLLRVVDLAALSDIAHAAGTLVAVDNTFMSPFFQRPLELGADLVVHSATKYLGGHSDAVHGAVVGRDPELGQQITFHQNAVGAVPGPFDCWLILRGLKTLAVRMRQHEANARRIAEFLSGHPPVEKVNYPGRPDHPQHAIAARQMDGFGGMLSFTVRGGLPAARAVARSTELFTLAESLGGVESLIELPAAMTHASIPAEVRQAIGIDDGLIRLSVGIEDAEDLVVDLERAIARGQD